MSKSDLEDYNCSRIAENPGSDLESESKSDSDGQQEKKSKFINKRRNLKTKSSLKPPPHNDCAKSGLDVKTAKPKSNIVVKHDPEGCLFIGNLTRSHTDDELNVILTSLFSRFGDLAFVKTLRDSQDRPYSFVQYIAIIDATKALSGITANREDRIIDGRKIRVEKAKVNRTLLINMAEFTPNIDEDGEELNQLEKILTGFGPVKQLQKVLFGEFRGFLKVQFKFREDAQSAFNHIYNNLKVNTLWKPVYKNKYQRFDFKSIFIAKISSDKVTENDLIKKFEVYGTIDRVKYQPLENCKESTTYAVIRYKERQACIKAIESENGTSWHGYQLRVEIKLITEHLFNINFMPNINTFMPPFYSPYFYQYLQPSPIYNHQSKAVFNQRANYPFPNHYNHPLPSINHNGLWIPYQNNGHYTQTSFKLAKGSYVNTSSPASEPNHKVTSEVVNPSDSNSNTSP